MSEREENYNIRQIIFWAIGLSILVVALIAFTFFMMYPSDGVIQKTPGGFRIYDWPITGNDCLTDLSTYVEIKNRDLDQGWIHYADPPGNSTDIMNHLDTYCSADGYDIQKEKMEDLRNQFDFLDMLEI